MNRCRASILYLTLIDGLSRWSPRLSGLEGNFKLIESFNPSLCEFSGYSGSLKEILAANQRI